MKIKMKKMLIILLFVLCFVASFAYFNLGVSEKYETQLEGLNPNQEEMLISIKKKKDIDRSKKIALIVIFLSSIGIYGISIIKTKKEEKF
ncbi:hypothetical protein [Myroides sp. TSA_177.3]|uniref:hypothetical protein n=1 Tax=Myroides sp. TSA_177.3 TaxID=3415650 RepID=UPI004045A9CB